MGILALTDDLIFSTKIETAAQAANVPLRLISRPSQLSEALKTADTHLVLIDLNGFQDTAVEQVRAIRNQLPQVPIVGYCSHIQAELQRQAQEAGCSKVVARSVFVGMLAGLMA